MSTDACISLLLDGPMQSWGHTSRFERRTSALHPTRSAIIGMIAAALGIDKNRGDESAQLARLGGLRLTTVKLDRRGRAGHRLPILRLEDYHTVTGIRRASGKIDDEATVQTYRHYLLDARFGVLMEGPAAVLLEIEAALMDPHWGVWLGRKCCIPATPVLVKLAPARSEAWHSLLLRAGYSGSECVEAFDHILEVSATESGAETIDDSPLGFGQPLGTRHAPRWIRRVPKSDSPASCQ